MVEAPNGLGTRFLGPHGTLEVGPMISEAQLYQDPPRGVYL